MSAEEKPEELADSELDGVLDGIEAAELIGMLEELLLMGSEFEEADPDKLVVVTTVPGKVVLGGELVDPTLLEELQTELPAGLLDAVDIVVLDDKPVVPELGGLLIGTKLVDPEPIEVTTGVTEVVSVLPGKTLLISEVADPELERMVMEDSVAFADEVGTLLLIEFRDSKPGELLGPDIEKLEINGVFDAGEVLLASEVVAVPELGKLVDVDPDKLVIEDAVALADTLEMLGDGLVGSDPMKSILIQSLYY